MLETLANWKLFFRNIGESIVRGIYNDIDSHDNFASSQSSKFEETNCFKQSLNSLSQTASLATEKRKEFSRLAMQMISRHSTIDFNLKSEHLELNYN